MCKAPKVTCSPIKAWLVLYGALCLNGPALAKESLVADLVQEVSFYAISLLGTPYRAGGSHPDTGMDCSGFVRHVFERMAGIRLPRSSREISQQGRSLIAAELQPGDLVFFNTLDQAFSHVGVYVGENRFIHASSSRTGTVMVSDMTQPYWSRRFDGARRLLDPAGASRLTP
jgi:cell wall-associated NlpC family hydrolase